MLDFNFYNPTRIIFGKDKIDVLDNFIAKDAKVLVLYGGGSVKRFGTLDKVLSALDGREVLEFGGIEPNPSYKTLMRAVKIVKEENVSFLLAVGGGSVMDGTKFINLLANYDGDNPEELLKAPTAWNQSIEKIPFGNVVTLPATGSEMNPGMVISHNGNKYGLGNPNLYPDFSILDPTLTFTLPQTQIANGVIDSFVHVLEQYATYPIDAKVQDRMAEGILQSLVEVGRYTMDNPEDYDARANLVWSSTMALNGLIGQGVPSDWSAHGIGHQLTALFGIDHAKTLAVIQPAIWTIRKKQKGAKLLQYGERVWGISEGSDDERIDLAISKTREFFESLGVKTHLSDYGVKASDIESIMVSLKRNGVDNISETGDLSLDIIKEILELAL